MVQRDLAQLGIAVAEDLVSGAQHVLTLRKILCLARQPAALFAPHMDGAAAVPQRSFAFSLRQVSQCVKQ